MAASKTTLLIVLITFAFSCVWISNAREMQSPRGLECFGACPPNQRDHLDQYFGTCFKEGDCANSCFPSCKSQKCVNHECICTEC